MKLTELLAQETITLAAGDQIIAKTAAAGYVPTYKDTTNIFQGGYVFQVVESGVANQLNIVPVLITEDGKGQKVEEKNLLLLSVTEKLYTLQQKMILFTEMLIILKTTTLLMFQQAQKLAMR
ncbi:hypothetical protein [Bacillus phage phiAGATE]|uniref:Uncharacterized protein n=1 Tax=Bacillus phage phiAGATE TaxID=1204533 RepID=L0L8I2_9CAUD|nr:Ig domain containing protein [Bacillus phage phiAGATE]AGB62734.1 hypothetical protein [Bacillus phage phiAGATE]